MDLFDPDFLLGDQVNAVVKSVFFQLHKAEIFFKDIPTQITGMLQ